VQLPVVNNCKKKAEPVRTLPPLTAVDIAGGGGWQSALYVVVRGLGHIMHSISACIQQGSAW